MKLDPGTIAASPRLARLLPGHLFLEATKRSPVVEGPAEALECVGAPGSAPAPAPSYREAKRLSGRYSTEDDLADWLADEGRAGSDLTIEAAHQWMTTWMRNQQYRPEPERNGGSRDVG